MKTALLALPLLLLAACQSTPADSASRSADTDNAGDGWTELFDGRTLDGWTTVGGRYDGHARWTVEDGAITGRQGPNREGGLIYTQGMYGDFELELDLRIDWPFDSGLFLRMLPPDTNLKGMQVTVDYRGDGECGGLYADGWIEHCPKGWDAFEKGEWNHFRVTCQGQPMHVAAWVNGTPLVDRTLDSAEGYAESGRIGLQVHGGEDVPLPTKVQFKNVRVRPL